MSVWATFQTQLDLAVYRHADKDRLKENARNRQGREELKDSPCARRTQHGNPPAQTDKRRSSFRPGLPVHFGRVREALRRDWRSSIDGVGRRLLR